MKSKVIMLITMFPVLILAAGIGFANTAPDHVVWRDYEEGIQFAKQVNRPIMINFFSERCRYCRLMDKNTYTDLKVIKALNEKFVPIKVDVKKHGDLARMYRATYLPTIWFITPQEEGIAGLIGYRPPHDFILVLEYIGDGFYKEMEFEDFMEMRGKSKK